MAYTYKYPRPAVTADCVVMTKETVKYDFHKACERIFICYIRCFNYLCKIIESVNSLYNNLRYVKKSI